MALTIVFDSNIWLSEQMLRHSAGAAVRFYLRRHDARIALPEVVRLEVILHLSERMKELATTTRQAHRSLLPLAGRLRELVLPEDAELEAIATRAFDDVGVPVCHIPFTVESARAAQRVDAIAVPNVLTLGATRQIDVSREDVLRVARTLQGLAVTIGPIGHRLGPRDGSSVLWRSLPPPPRPSDLVSSWSRPRDWSASRGSASRGSSPQRASNIEDLRGMQRKTRVHAAVQQRRR